MTYILIPSEQAPRSNRTVNSAPNPFLPMIEALLETVDKKTQRSADAAQVVVSDVERRVYADGRVQDDATHLGRVKRLIGEAAREAGFSARITGDDETIYVRLTPLIVRARD